MGAPVTAPGVGRYLRLLACVLLVPLLGAGVAAILRWHADATFAGEVAGSLPLGDPGRNRVETLSGLCAGSDADTYEACNADAGYRLFVTASIRCPTLVLAGAADTAVPMHHARQLHEGIAHSRLVAIDGADHAMIWADPDRFVREVDAFLDA